MRGTIDSTTTIKIMLIILFGIIIYQVATGIYLKDKVPVCKSDWKKVCSVWMDESNIEYYDSNLQLVDVFDYIFFSEYNITGISFNKVNESYAIAKLYTSENATLDIDEEIELFCKSYELRCESNAED